MFILSISSRYIYGQQLLSFFYFNAIEWTLLLLLLSLSSSRLHYSLFTNFKKLLFLRLIFLCFFTLIFH